MWQLWASIVADLWQVTFFFFVSKRGIMPTYQGCYETCMNICERPSIYRNNGCLKNVKVAKAVKAILEQAL